MKRKPTHPWRAWQGREDSPLGGRAQASRREPVQPNAGAERRAPQAHLPRYHYVPGRKP